MLIASLFSLLMIPSTPAQAASAVPVTSSVSFSIFESTGGGNYTYYSCDGLESLTKSMLKKMGAGDIRVSCSGGLDGGQYFGSPYIRASFVHPVLASGGADAEYKEVTLRGSDNCHAAQEIFAALRTKLDLASVEGDRRFCEARQSYKIQVEALMWD